MLHSRAVEAEKLELDNHSLKIGLWDLKIKIDELRSQLAHEEEEYAYFIETGSVPVEEFKSEGTDLEEMGGKSGESSSHT